MTLRFVPSSTGLPSKRCPGIGFFSRVGREIGVFRHVTPPTTLCLEFTRETGLILRCAGNVGNPFQTKQGNRPSCRKQEGRRCSDEVVREPRCSCRVRPACPGTFGVASRAPVYYEGTVQFVCKYLAIQLAQLRAPLGEKLAKTFQLPHCNGLQSYRE